MLFVSLFKHLGGFFVDSGSCFFIRTLYQVCSSTKIRIALESDQVGGISTLD
ncbi:hypothetical protein SAMN03080598_00324 [Algoriphagus boritolerans DSM 17298 = JCM 18970]|uniref:Uncharacterized protein n=1 Tax=Algoriphagus boritolerans DSM 17298 = JCM 18970 TaxID=1120964 RepID=A0A1H5S873_9BACT|nr:hypothetical protein SAMN03080598_00324 [Algoriphagus boritolerans DSM 17298 = JCM 18970]